MDATIASFFYENGISFDIVGSSSFARIIDVSMRFAKQILFKVKMLLLAKICLRNFLIKHTKPRIRFLILNFILTTTPVALRL